MWSVIRVDKLRYVNWFPVRCVTPFWVNRFSTRGKGTLSKERDKLLTKIYAPLKHLDQHSTEYKNLATSGKVWEDYFQPGDSERYGYTNLQQVWMNFEFKDKERSVLIRTSGTRRNPP